MKKVQDFKVVSYEWLNESSYVIKLQSDSEIPAILPGNFAELEIPNAPDVFLRRPLSILDVDYENRILSFYIKVIGKGTRKLGTYQKGQKLSIIYPLGNQFSINGNSNVLIVGGGSGIAAFILLARENQKKGVKTTFLFGARTKDEIVLNKEFGKYGVILVTTEDGSLGEKGLVTQHSVFSKDLPFLNI